MRPTQRLQTLLLLMPAAALAQAPNDSCLSATNLIINESGAMCIWEPIGVPGTEVFTESTTLAGPEFPYPSSGLACSGYALNQTVPSNDVWYRFQPLCYFTLEVSPGPFYTTDSVQITIWHGPDCSQLVPAQCFSLTPADTILTELGNYENSSYYLQISSTSLSTSSQFSFCLRGEGQPCAPQVYAYGAPTPVLCFPFEVNTIDAAAVSAPGGASILLDDAYGPYTIVWSDGVTDLFSRNDLPVGEHSVSVTAANGCTEVIPFAINLDPSLGFYHSTQAVPRIYMDANGWVVDLGNAPHGSGTLVVYDACGKRLFSRAFGDASRIGIGALKPGVHLATLNYADGRALRLSFVATP
ncbi:MAG: hypothetical protein IPM12_02435 [Flavobacteriales bacterium]|nr:hypothetical protein [Flavobacteriales bacterium]